MAYSTKSLATKFARAGSSALLAACLFVGPAMAQSVVIEQGAPVESTEKKTTVKEKWNGDTEVREKTTTTAPSTDTTIRTEQQVVEPSTSTTTTTTVR